LKIYIDTIIFDLQKSGGISVYWFEIISRFVTDSNIELILIDSNEPKENILYGKLDLSDIKIIKYKKFLNRYRAVNYRENEKHIFISSYYRYSKNKNAINVTIIHDFTYEYFVKGLKLFVHHRQKKKAVKKSEKLICISQNTKSDLIKFFGDMVNKKEIHVIYNGVGECYRHLTKAELLEIENKNEFLKDIKSQFVLFVGARGGYKNWNEAIELFKKLPQEYFMVSVGGSPLNEDEQNLLNETSDRHIYIPPAGNEVLAYLYNKAEALLYLSDYEGFGIPVVEAQRCGCPVLAKPVSSIPEVAGDGVHFIGSDANIEGIKEFFSRKYQYTLDFSWEKCYNELRECLKIN